MLCRLSESWPSSQPLRFFNSRPKAAVREPGVWCQESSNARLFACEALKGSKLALSTYPQFVHPTNRGHSWASVAAGLFSGDGSIQRRSGTGRVVWFIQTCTRCNSDIALGGRRGYCLFAGVSFLSKGTRFKAA